MASPTLSQADLRIAGVRRGAPVRITVDGRSIDAFEGESVAAAMWAAGVRPRASTDTGPPARAIACAMGVCQQCAVWIDGRRVEACRTPVRAGLVASSIP